MAKRKQAKSRGKRTKSAAPDPRQLGLFEAVEARPVALPAQVRAAKRRTAKPRLASALDRPVVFSAAEAAQYLGVSVSTLKNWRAKAIGPRWVMRGARLVAYRPADLERFLDESSAKR